jgi:transglutaminase-like putative cysteine protease
MHVRSPQAALWRGQAYDRFDGTTWTSSDPSIRSISRGFGDAIDIPSDDTPSTVPGQTVRSRTVVQTFFIVKRQPNIVFAAYRPREVYFPTGRLAIDRFDSLRSPILLEPGTIYSAVSDVPVATPSELRASPGVWPEQVTRRYTQLPADLPARVVRLAHLITDGEATTYDKVMAVQRWLQIHTRYTLDIPPDPTGTDAVDYFLFERRNGYCEHIASAMAILLRAVGIPTMFVVGFGPGEHNLFTGYYDVRESDAHSWVEVDYPGVGWMDYDPTFGVPDAAPGLGARFVAAQVLSAVARFLARAMPGPVRAAALAVGRAFRAAAQSWPVAVGLVLTAACVVAFVRRRRRRRRAPPLQGAAAAFASLCESFGRRGRARPAHRTPSEHLKALLAEDPVAREASADVERIVRAFERERFATGPLDEEDVAESLAAAERIRERVR